MENPITLTPVNAGLLSEPPVYGLQITVKDGGGVPVTDALIQIYDNNNNVYREKAEHTGSGIYRGARERPGTYTITVYKAPNPSHKETVTVTQTGCHADTAAITVTLIP